MRGAPAPDPVHLLVQREAAARGFSLAGIADAVPLRDAASHLQAWADAGHAADLGWMTRNPPERADARTLLPTVASIVSVAVEQPTETEPFRAEERFGRVARYAWGLDYHELVIPRLEDLARRLTDVLGGRRWRVACDHAPLLERAVAERAGLGFFGKNTCLLRPRQGSFFFLAEILLDVALPPTRAAGATDHCGTCRRCLDVCPTGALPAPFVLDARRCVSYLTIEHRGPIPRSIRTQVGSWVFGCDDCQDVCPFNHWARPSTWPELRPEAGVGPRLDLVEVLGIRTDDAFRARFRGTPLLRPKRRGLLRNAAVVAANVGARAAVDVLVDAVLRDPEPLVRSHALAALGALDGGRARRLADRAKASDPDEGVRAEARDVLEPG